MRSLRRGLMAFGVSAMAAAFLAGPAAAAELVIDEPVTQSGATIGEELVVRGRGCAADTSVEVFLDGRPLGTTPSDANGAFDTTVFVPSDIELDADMEEASESSLVVTCGDQRTGVVVALNPPVPNSEVEDAPLVEAVPPSVVEVIDGSTVGFRYDESDDPRGALVLGGGVLAVTGALVLARRRRRTG